MIPGARSERLYLSDIREAVDRILGYTAGGREAFLADLRTQDAVVRNLEVIGEATRGVDYFRVDVEVVWDVVQNDLPALRPQIDALLALG